MREVRNKIKSKNYPTQEQTEFNEFISAAPGLPVDLCGGGIMPECVNFEFENDGLVPRKPMVLKYDLRLHNKNDPLATSIHLISFKSFESYTDNTKDFSAIVSSHGAIQTLGANSYWSGYAIINLLQNVNYLKSIDYRPVYGRLSLLVERSINNEINSEILDFNTYIDSTTGGTFDIGIRQLGLPKPEYTFGITDFFSGGIGKRWLGIEYVFKDENGVIIRSSGIATKLASRFRSLIVLPQNIGTLGITHILVYASDTYNPASAEQQSGHPTQMYLLAEVPVSNVGVQGYIYDESMDSDYEGDDKWNVHYGLGGSNNPRIAIHAGREDGKIREPSEFAQDFVFNEGIQEDFNLIPMENALCFAGNRLWGAVGDKVIYSHEAGSPRQEQRMPSAIIECGIGNIIDIVELDGHLYVFGAKGIVRIDNADATSLAGKPHLISGQSCEGARVKALSSFGIFVLMHDKAMFLDANTLEYNSNVKGMDFNSILGELIGYITDLKSFLGDLYFITQEKLFKINFRQNKGLTEIRHADGLLAVSIVSINNAELQVLYKKYDVNLDRMELSVWSILADPHSIDFQVCQTEDISRIFYYATFAKSVPHGFVEHWDTSVLACLPEGTEVGTETIVDGAYCEGKYASNDWDSHHPRNFLITAANGGQRPIGQALAVRVRVKFGKDFDYKKFENEENMAIHAVKITTIKQEEVFNQRFNPNARQGREFLLMNDNGIFYEQERSNNG